MATYLEILDTAVKIGLGAAITGIATYLVTKLKSEQDRKNEMAKYNRSLFERLSLGFEESASTLTKIVLLLQKAVVSGADHRGQYVSEAQELYLKVYEQLNGTEALATLVGTSMLRERLSLYADLASEFHDLVRTFPDDHDKLSPAVERLNAAREDV